MSSEITLRPCRRIDGTLEVPGDKGISHRAVLIGAIGHGGMEIRNLSPAADVVSSLGAIRALGVELEGSGASVHAVPNRKGGVERVLRESLDSQILVVGQGRNGLKSPKADLDAGNSGTTIRFLAGILAPSPVSATLTGDISIKRRPMGRVVEPLRAMGAEIQTEPGGLAPLRIHGRRLTGVAHTLEIASAQVKSALLLAGLGADGETSVQEPVPSRDHTERMLEYLGIQVAKQINRLIVKAAEIHNGKVTVPGDFSSAAFLLVAAAIVPEGSIVIDNVGVNPSRTGLLDVLREFGAQVELADERVVSGEPVATVSVRAGDRRRVWVGGDLTVRCIDELPLVALLGAMASGGVTEIRDAAELRVKESDRVATTAAMLRGFGVGVEELPDGLVVRGGARVEGAVVDSAGDHRIAMTAAIGALAARGPTTISGWDAVAVSYPGFETDLARVAIP